MGTATPRERRFDDDSIHEAIAQRAREIWHERGCTEGHAAEDWAQAEAEVRAQLAAGFQHSHRLIVVRAGGVLYTGEYDPQACAYHPGELEPGSPISVHLEDDQMRLTLADGRELEARVVRALKT